MTGGGPDRVSEGWTGPGYVERQRRELTGRRRMLRLYLELINALGPADADTVTGWLDDCESELTALDAMGPEELRTAIITELESLWEELSSAVERKDSKAVTALSGAIAALRAELRR